MAEEKEDKRTKKKEEIPATVNTEAEPLKTKVKTKEQILRFQFYVKKGSDMVIADETIMDAIKRVKDGWNYFDYPASWGLNKDKILAILEKAGASRPMLVASNTIEK